MSNPLVIQNRREKQRFFFFVVILLLAIFFYEWQAKDMKLFMAFIFLVIYIFWPAINLFNIYKYKQGWGVSGGGVSGGYFVMPRKATNRQRSLLLGSSLFQLGFYVLFLIFSAWLWFSGSIKF